MESKTLCVTDKLFTTGSRYPREWPIDWDFMASHLNTNVAWVQILAAWFPPLEAEMPITCFPVAVRVNWGNPLTIQGLTDSHEVRASWGSGGSSTLPIFLSLVAVLSQHVSDLSLRQISGKRKVREGSLLFDSQIRSETTMAGWSWQEEVRAVVHIFSISWSSGDGYRCSACFTFSAGLGLHSMGWYRLHKLR